MASRAGGKRALARRCKGWTLQRLGGADKKSKSGETGWDKAARESVVSKADFLSAAIGIRSTAKWWQPWALVYFPCVRTHEATISGLLCVRQRACTVEREVWHPITATV